MFEEWAGDASVFDFELLPQSSERLCRQKPAWSIAYGLGCEYVIDRPRSQNGNLG